MRRIRLLLIWILLLRAESSMAQQISKSRVLCQQHFIIETFIKPQSAKGAFQVRKPSDIDSLFMVVETDWRKASKDSLKKYPSELTPAEFAQLDAYCYFWGLASMTKDLNVDVHYNQTLSRYMTAAMLRDAAILERVATPATIRIIHNGNLGNTLAIGSAIKADRQIFEQTYQVYQVYESLLSRLASQNDTTVSNSAAVPLKALRKYSYTMQAVHAYNQEEYEKAFNLLITGVSMDRFSKTRAIDLTRKLVKYYATQNDKDRCYTLLHMLALNSTPDNLNRDTLAALYAKIDPAVGLEVYHNFQKKLSTSAFRNSNQAVRLPFSWEFICNSVPADKLKKTKYILIDFWYTGCAPCMEEIPALNAFYDQIKQRDDILFLSVSTDYRNGKRSKSLVTQRVNALNIRYPVYYDEPLLALDKQLDISAYPTKFILTATGTVLEKTDHSAITLESFNAFLKESL